MSKGMKKGKKKDPRPFSFLGRGSLFLYRLAISDAK